VATISKFSNRTIRPLPVSAIYSVPSGITTISSAAEMGKSTSAAGL
jgi:hypothetical protein